MSTFNELISADVQWKLNIVRRNLEVENWVELISEAQEQMLREVIDLSEELPSSVYQTLISPLERLLNHSSYHLKQEIRKILSGHRDQNSNITSLSHYFAHRHANLSEHQTPIKVFVRQPFTESGQVQKGIVQGVLDLLGQIDAQHCALNLLTGTEAQSQDTFRQAFEQKTGLSFTPGNFRQHRLQLLDEADAMVIVRTSLSESGAFEVAYNTFAGRKIPMFFAVWGQAPIKTTLLRDLDEVCSATYVEFDNPTDLITPLQEFLVTVSCQLQPYRSYSNAA